MTQLHNHGPWRLRTFRSPPDIEALIKRLTALHKVSFAELVRAPVMTNTTGKSAFPEDHPLSIGNGGATATGMVEHFLRKADLVFGIGSTFYQSLMVAPIPSGKVMVQCTADERDLSRFQTRQE